MRTSRLAVFAVMAALVLSACGTDDEGGDGGDGGDASGFEPGTTMAELAEAGTIRVGTKYDQPLFGQVNLEGEPEGFDVEIAKITGPESFADESKTVCSVQGSTPSETIREYLANAGEQLVLFGGYQECVDALDAGDVDAVTTDNVILMGYISESPDAYKLVESGTFTEEPITVPTVDRY